MVLTYKNKFNMKYGFLKDASHSIAQISQLTGYKKSGLVEAGRGDEVPDEEWWKSIRALEPPVPPPANPSNPKCVLCSNPCDCPFGNNAQPVKEGKCCDDCNVTKVIPARMARFVRRQ
jgi:hypothetical protein